MDKCTHSFAGFNRDDLLKLMGSGKDNTKDSRFMNKKTNLQISYSELLILLSALDPYYDITSRSPDFYSEKYNEEIRNIFRKLMDRIMEIKEVEQKIILSKQYKSCRLCLDMIECGEVPSFFAGHAYCEKCWLYHKYYILLTNKFDGFEEEQEWERKNDSGNQY